MEFGPLIVGLVSTFFLAAGLLWRYGQPGRHHMAVTASVFLAWYFSMLIIILMPLDVSSVSKNFPILLNRYVNLTIWYVFFFLISSVQWLIRKVIEPMCQLNL